MSARRYLVVDVFAEAKYEGNPLACVLDCDGLSTETMQALARETNLSETTFVLGHAPRDGAWDVRIFVPTREIPFAGHPTLGTAWTIARELAKGAPERVVLRLGIGPVPVDLVDDARGGVAWMAPPAPAAGRRREAADGARAVGLDPSDLDPRLPVQEYAIGVDFLVVPVRGVDALRRARLSLEELARVAPGLVGGVLVVSSEPYDATHDLAVRMFFDALGVREDPATGAGAACLAAYLSEHRFGGGGDLDLRVAQGRAIQRPSLLHIRARRDGGSVAVSVGGRVIPVLRGELL
jgi:trans-2,3-dihydro-3-hydroxyanthranilate isomerase